MSPATVSPRRRRRPPKGRQPFAVQCPKCRANLPSTHYNQPEPLSCPRCGTRVSVEVFPAFLQGETPGGYGQPLAEADEAACFFHPDKRADVSCSSCGRFVCEMCNTAPVGPPTCVSCFNREIAEGQYPNAVLNPAGLALTLTFLPLIIFPLTILTAPMALYLAIAGWRKSKSIHGSNRGRLLVAAIFSSLQIIGWLLYLWSITANHLLR